MKMILSAFAAALLLVGCGKDAPKTIKDIDSSIVSVQDVKSGDKSIVQIALKLRGMSVDSDMQSAMMRMKDVTQGIKTHFADLKADGLHYVLSADLVDAYGNSKQTEVLEIPFAMSDVRQINFDSRQFTPWGLMNLAGKPKVLHPAGVEFLIAYCKDPDNLNYAQNFCLRAAGLG